MTEQEVITRVLAQHSQQASEKFTQEVFWRNYLKGWLELRPAVWQNYQAGLQGAVNALQTQTGIKHNWKSACPARPALPALTPGPKSCTKPDICTITPGCGLPLSRFSPCACLGNWGPIFSCATCWMAIPPPTHWAGAGLPSYRQRAKPT